jgi:hypothetical protein
VTITRVGLGIAKQTFQLHGVDERDQPRLRKQLPRAKVLEFFAQLPPCEIGIEACGGSHYWSRELTKLGHTVSPGRNTGLPCGDEHDRRSTPDASSCDSSTRPGPPRRQARWGHLLRQ